eukprot:896540_1
MTGIHPVSSRSNDDEDEDDPNVDDADSADGDEHDESPFHRIKREDETQIQNTSTGYNIHTSIKDWLIQIDLIQYNHTFLHAGYETVGDVVTATKTDLENINITKYYHIKKILNHINDTKTNHPLSDITNHQHVPVQVNAPTCSSAPTTAVIDLCTPTPTPPPTQASFNSTPSNNLKSTFSNSNPPLSRPQNQQRSIIDDATRHYLEKRLFRAQTQRFEITDQKHIEANSRWFQVVSHDSKVQVDPYEVFIGSRPTCTCRDNQKGFYRCKHMLFVFLNGLSVSPHDERIYYRHYS